MRERSDYSIWEGKKVCGLAVMTILRGNIVAENGETTAEKPHGEFFLLEAR